MTSTNFNHQKPLHRQSISDNLSKGSGDVSTAAARQLMETVLRLMSQQQRWYADMILLSDQQQRQLEMLGVEQAVLQRCRQLQSREGLGKSDAPCLQRQYLLSCENDSGYTALHQAIYSGDLCHILFLLRHAATASNDSSSTPRLSRRPMEILYNNSNLKDNPLIRAMVTATDHEGMTPAALLASQQRRDLAACRAFLTQVKAQHRRARSNSLRQASSGLSASSSSAVENEQNEFDLLSRALMRSTQQGDNEDSSSSNSHDDDNNSDRPASAEVTYACEVFTFGRAHHCALGVVASNRHRHAESEAAASQQHQLRPQRVHFAQDTVGRSGSAVAVASATHHTLTVTASGKLYAFGLGKGGRLGTGDEKPCSTPVRVGGPLMRQVVIAVAAAENHSLCVAASGYVYAWGSNRFGQLGSTSAESSTARCLPRRVDDLKHVVCVSVAAGAKHSVALSQHGEVYVWGDNGAGQLGFSGRSSSNNSLHKVQRVEALWKAANGPKKVVAIAASERSTLVLISSSGQRSLPVNSIYCWGHGSHAPYKVQFDATKSSRPINPVAIACARYHNAAITSDGHVFTWGLHADSLGTSSSNSRNRSNSGSNSFVVSAPLTAPQLVADMLPENGGGMAVAVSASENHTAVVTDTGDLFTWGDTFKSNILGHEGVRWQPDPKRVPGVHRAVGVSAAKEHTVLLIGTVFPPLSAASTSLPPETSIMSLEDLAAQRIMEHVDMFNVIPILTMAERTQTSCLLMYCRDFVRRNLDGVLNVGQKSVMNCFLNEQLVGCTIGANRNEEDRDDRCHPFIADVVLAGSTRKPLLGSEILCNVDDWLVACEVLCRQPAVARMINRFGTSSDELYKSKEDTSRARRDRVRTLSFSENSVIRSENSEGARSHTDSFCSERCEVLTSNMDLSSKDLAEGKLACLSKEVRAIRKRLGQIAKLEDSVDDVLFLSSEQQRKIARRPQLEADLLVFEPAIEAVEKRLRKLSIAEDNVELERPKRDNALTKMPSPEEPNKDKLPENDVLDSDATESISPSPSSLRCEVCQITCPDRKSHELHLNGRKHRNRIAQVADEEKKRVASSMIEEQQRQLLLASTRGPQAACTKDSVNPWNKSDKRQSAQPRYKLPPPPHPVQETVPAPQGSNSARSPAAKSLREIMAEESQQSNISSKVAPFQLPSGSAPPMKCPPWAASTVLVNVASDFSSPSQKSTYSLGDFMLEPSPNVASPRPAGWSSPKAPACRKDAAASISFRDIQRQEQEFKEKEDHTFGANGSWFIERRERAGSFKEIQSETAQENEEQLFIEEQMRIEQQIYQELAAKQAEEEKKAQKHQNNRRTNKNKAGNVQRRKSGGSRSTVTETTRNVKESQPSEGKGEFGGSSQSKKRPRRNNAPAATDSKRKQSSQHRKQPPSVS